MANYKAIVKVINITPNRAGGDTKELEVEVASSTIEGLISKVSTVIGLVKED